MGDLANTVSAGGQETEHKSNPSPKVHIASMQLFEGVSDDLLRKISDDMVGFFSTGMEIVREEDAAAGLIVLLHGQARVLRNGTYLVTRTAGEIIGEQAILEHAPRSATVVADGMVKALILPRGVVDSLLQDATFARNMARVLSAKLREATTERSVRYRDEERLFSEFSAHVSPQIASWLLSKGSSYGDPRFVDAVILMADVRSFTEKCARLGPNDIASDLSLYLDAVVDVIHRFDGFVDKFIGDAVLAVWGVTPADEVLGLALKAFECAREMVQTAASLRFGGEPIEIGIGLDQGRIFVGNVGGRGKRQFTVLGMPVNLASRFQSECKALQSNIVLGQTAYDALPDAIRAHLRRHEGRSIRGAGILSVYSWAADKGRSQTKGGPDELDISNQ